MYNQSKHCKSLKGPLFRIVTVNNTYINIYILYNITWCIYNDLLQVYLWYVMYIFRGVSPSHSVDRSLYLFSIYKKIKYRYSFFSIHHHVDPRYKMWMENNNRNKSENQNVNGKSILASSPSVVDRALRCINIITHTNTQYEHTHVIVIFLKRVHNIYIYYIHERNHKSTHGLHSIISCCS